MRDPSLIMRIVEMIETEIDTVIDLWRRCELTRPWNDPRADIALAVRSLNADVLVGHSDDAVTATVMVGFDGHRGWVYYLAVDPDARRGGLGREMMESAEAWLRARRAPKIHLMVRDENTAVAAFYQRLGYELQATKVFGKWLASDGK